MKFRKVGAVIIGTPFLLAAIIIMSPLILMNEFLDMMGELLDEM